MSKIERGESMINKMEFDHLKELIGDVTSEFTEFCSDLEDAGRVYDAIDALLEFVEDLR